MPALDSITSANNISDYEYNKLYETALNSIAGAHNVSKTTPADKNIFLKQTTLTQPNAENTKDTFISSKKTEINKKGLTAGLIIAAATAAAVVYAVKSGKLRELAVNINGNKVQKEGSKVLEESKSVFDKAKNTMGEVTGFIKKGNENGFAEFKDESGKVIKFDISEHGFNVMEEFDASNVLKRSTRFNSDNLEVLKIKEFINSTDKKYNEISISGNKPYLIRKEAKETTDGKNRKSAKLFDFKNDILKRYTENYEELTDGGLKFSKRFYFDNDILKGYTKNYKKLTDGSRKLAKHIDFNNDNEVTDYARNIRLDKHLNPIKRT